MPLVFAVHYTFFLEPTPFWGLVLKLLSKFTFSRLKVAKEFLSNFFTLIGQAKRQLYVTLTIFLLLPVSTQNTIKLKTQLSRAESSCGEIQHQ